MLKKLFITPYFGEFPSWMPKYLEHIKHLKKWGYDWFITTDLDDFVARANKHLGVNVNFMQPGNSKCHDFRTTYGVMYVDKIASYDYWGLTDFDCVYGDIPSFMTDDQIAQYDIWSNHFNYVCGPWTLMKNTDKVNNLFRNVRGWENILAYPRIDGGGRWTEQEYSEMVDREAEVGKIARKYTHFQGHDPNVWENLKMDGDKLYDGEDEIMTFHFNRRKIWPL